MRNTSIGLARILLVPLLACICAAPFYGQTTETESHPQQLPADATNGKKSNRVVGVIPAFNASDDVNAPALSPRQKFGLFSKTATDPYTLIMPAVNAAVYSAAGVSSGYGSGFSGLSKRYAASLADTTSGNFFRLYAYPAMLHQDPRYFRVSRGSIGKRTKHVFGAVIITRNDNLTFGFNWSKLLASASSSALSNAYYPAENRGARLTLSHIGLSYLLEIGSNGLKEFWPDIAQWRRNKKGQNEKKNSGATTEPRAVDEQHDPEP